MRKFTRGSAWTIALAIGVVSAAVFVASRIDSPAPGRMTASSDAPAAASGRRAPAAREERAVPAQPPGDADAIPFAPRVYPATPLPAPVSTPSSPHPAAPAGPAILPGAAPSSGASSGFFSQPLANGTPLSTVLDRLKAAADSGDSGAACRVGLELLRCAAGAPLVTATTSGPVITQAQCAGMSPSDRESAPRYLAQAAAAGSEAARRALAGDTSVSPTQCGR